MKPISLLLSLALVAPTLSMTSCSSDDPLDGEGDAFPTGKSDGGIDPGSPEDRAVRALVNDASVDVATLDDDAGLHATAAKNIIAHRNGADGLVGTADDDPFDTLKELDDVPYVGKYALDALLAYAIANGYLPEDDANFTADAIFSPQPASSSHTARIAQMIDDTQRSIDIAMYSFSNADISDALERAVDRGVAVRFVFETAGEDKKLTGSDLENSKSGRLERIGVNVRYVNKIMHHKFAIFDGPRYDLGDAAGAKLVTGSANWSYGGASIYDENTVFLAGAPEAALRFQREFDHMWAHSRDVVVDSSLPYELSDQTITDADITDNPDYDAYFTSKNFNVSATSTTFRLNWESTAVADKWVEAIENATDSIRIASGHMRLRPVAEALIAKKQADPDIEIEVYLDQQEYISAWGHSDQQNDIDDCLATASSDKDRFNCENKSFLFGKMIGDAGIDVRYKVYAYRWHYSYALQMHHKYMIVDDDEVLTGSYNLSINAEHETFENVSHFKGAAAQPLVDVYLDNFQELFELGRADDLLGDVRDEIETADPVPLVFDSMSLTWQEYTDLKDLIQDNCADINTDPYRTEPEKHKDCPRN